MLDILFVCNGCSWGSDLILGNITCITLPKLEYGLEVHAKMTWPMWRSFMCRTYGTPICLTLNTPG